MTWKSNLRQGLKMITNCPIHGRSGVCIFSPVLLEFQSDGTLPAVVTVEMKDSPEEIAFFRFCISPEEAEKYSVVKGTLPFDEHTMEIMDGLKQMCGLCLDERRKALEAQQRNTE